MHLGRCCHCSFVGASQWTLLDCEVGPTGEVAGETGTWTRYGQNVFRGITARYSWATVIATASVVSPLRYTYTLDTTQTHNPVNIAMDQGISGGVRHSVGTLSASHWLQPTAIDETSLFLSVDSGTNTGSGIAGDSTIELYRIRVWIDGVDATGIVDATSFTLIGGQEVSLTSLIAWAEPYARQFVEIDVWWRTTVDNQYIQVKSVGNTRPELRLTYETSENPATQKCQIWNGATQILQSDATYNVIGMLFDNTVEVDAVYPLVTVRRISNNRVVRYRPNNTDDAPNTSLPVSGAGTFPAHGAWTNGTSQTIIAVQSALTSSSGTSFPPTVYGAGIPASLTMVRV